MSKKDDLATLIAENLNKLDGNKIAYFLGVESAPTDFTDFISTGSSILDIILANRPKGGFACGRIHELQGNEGSGKSLIAAHALADTQKRGGVAVLIDTETAVNYDFFDAVGLDMKRMVYVSENVTERIFSHIEQIIETVRKSDKDRLVTIVVDSIAGATTDSESEADHGTEGYGTEKAKIISKALRKITKLIGDQKIALIFTNQLRQRIGAMPFQDPYVTSGGKAIAFHTTTRTRLSIVGTIKDSDGEAVGVKVRAKVLKNRQGPPYREAEFVILFNKGIDDYGSWYDVLKERNIIKTTGAWSTWKDKDGKEYKFQKSSLEQLLKENNQLREQMYAQICDALVMKYDDDMGELTEADEVPEDDS